MYFELFSIVFFTRCLCFAVRQRMSVLRFVWKVIGQNGIEKIGLFAIVKAIRRLSNRHFSAFYDLFNVFFYQPNKKHFVHQISRFTLFCETCETCEIPSSSCCNENWTMFSVLETGGLNKSAQHMIYFLNCRFFFPFFPSVCMRIFVRNGLHTFTPSISINW